MIPAAGHWSISLTSGKIASEGISVTGRQDNSGVSSAINPRPGLEGDWNEREVGSISQDTGEVDITIPSSVVARSLWMIGGRPVRIGHGSGEGEGQGPRWPR